MRVVVKIGTNVLSNPDGTLHAEHIHSLVQGLVTWHKAGWQVVMISSGAIGAGMGYLGWQEKPKTLRDKQAAAAVGQVRLMDIYAELFTQYNIKIGQKI